MNVSATTPATSGVPTRRPTMRYITLDPRTEELKKKGDEKPNLQKSLLNLLDGDNQSIERLAFERDPSRTNEYASIYRAKTALIPDHLLKRIAIQDSLVAAIVNTRSNHVGAFGRPAKDRFSIGFKLDVDEEWFADLDDNTKKRVQDRVADVEQTILTCGNTKGWSETEKMTFSDYLKLSARNAVIVGRVATEVIWTPDPRDPADPKKRKFHSFRPTDAGTIYYAAPYKSAAEAVRKQAKFLLEQLKNDKLTPEMYEAEEYDWVQVIEGKPFQVFTAQEMLVQNFYPVTDVELNGYPLTPIDTTISAITTHINITTHNKLYFQSGRAARGMLIIKSNDVDLNVVQAVRQQFNASINSVSNSWRMPVFGIGVEDEITWAPIDSGGRDMEFQYLSDQNAREILSAFQMSPEELPGYQHLSRGTNNQSLSESSQEYKLEAARDVGIRPLIQGFEDFVNSSLLPIIAPDICEYVEFKMVGLDAETPEKESIRIQQDMPVHMTYSEVLEKVEKDPLPPDMCGDIPLNPQFGQVMQNYMTFGEILEKFMGKKDASTNPQFQFYQNPFWFQWVQIQMQQQQMEMQQQQMQMQAQQGPPPQDGGGGGDGGAPQGGSGGSSGGDGGGSGGDNSSGGGSDTAKNEDSELGSGIDQLSEMFSKSDRLPPSKRRLREKHEKTVSNIMDAWEEDSRKLIADITRVTEAHVPSKD